MSMERKRGTKYSIEARYYNANGFAVAIVASITHEVDWAVYIGGTLDSLSEGETMRFVAKHGCKLPELDAHHFFPQLKHLPYRY